MGNLRAARLLGARLAVAAALAFGLGGTASPLPAAQPMQEGAPSFHYQGFLTSPDGSPVNGTVGVLEFKLWDALTGGSVVADGMRFESVPVTDGLVDLELTPDTGQVFDGSARWLSIELDGVPLEPRQPVAATPYALGLVPGAYVASANDGPNLSVANLGTGTAVSAFSQSGFAVFASSADTAAVIATSGTVPDVYVHAKHAIAALGEETGIVAWGGQVGLSASGTRGVVGTTATGEIGSAGVWGESSADLGTGVAGVAGGLDGRGVSGTADRGAGVLGTGETGVRGVSAVGPGVVGEGSIGVSGSSNGGSGVLGTSQLGYGVRGEGLQAGVSGMAVGFGAVGPGVEGRADSSTGVLGVSTSGDGVVGNSQSGVGVYGNGAQGVFGEGGTGVRGKSGTESGEGVHGQGTGRLTEGVLGTSEGELGAGVYGIAGGSNAIGVWGATNAATYGLYTQQSLFVGGSCVGCNLSFVARNAGDTALRRGDVVLLRGVDAPLAGQSIPVLLGAPPAPDREGVVGVLVGAARASTRSARTTGGELADDLVTVAELDRDAAARPGGLMIVVTQGLAQVRLGDDAASAPAGSLLVVAPSVADDGALAVGLDGLASTAWVVGRSVEDPPAGSALVWAMLQGSPAAGVAP